MIQGQTILRNVASVLFVQAPVLGGLLLACTLIRPEMTLTGLAAMAAAWGLGHCLGVRQEYLENGVYTYNPLLVGLSLGYGRDLTASLVLMAMLAGGLTLLVAIVLADRLLTRHQLPVLSLPFSLVAALVGLGLPKATTPVIPVTTWPALFAGYTRALGSIVFAPHPWAGLILSVGLLVHSRILWVLSLIGYGAGVLVLYAGSGDFAAAARTPQLFNSILIAMALGGIFCLPSLKSYGYAFLFAGLGAFLLQSLGRLEQTVGLQTYAWAFNSVTLLTLVVFRVLQEPLLVKTSAPTPEETLEQCLQQHRRFGGTAEPALGLPFAGVWTVWQGMDGRWTHKGILRYAYDFVITDEEGCNHNGNPSRLDSYYAFGKPVFAPIDGVVVSLVRHLKDAPIGHPDSEQNWGNHVVLQSASGLFVELSHFACNSIVVTAGEAVEEGQFLGTCGNSGYSPQPHIHIQVQTTSALGSPTRPFGFTNLLHDNCFVTTCRPVENDRCQPMTRDSFLDGAMNFVLDETLTCQMATGRQHWSVATGEDGCCMFASKTGGLHFGKHRGCFYSHRLEGDDPALLALHLALPKLPLYYRGDLRWTDTVSRRYLLSGWRRWLHAALVPLCPELSLQTTRHRFAGRGRVVTRIESKWWGIDKGYEVTIHPDWGIQGVNETGAHRVPETKPSRPAPVLQTELRP